MRADASHELGAGHVMRCLALVAAIGQRATFVCADVPGHLGALVRALGHELRLLAPSADLMVDAEFTASVGTGADWLIVDHYGLEASWESQMPCPVLAVDDLANRPHECEVLLDQNLGRSPRDYDHLVSPRTRRLVGPQYALLRPDFESMRPIALDRRAQRLNEPVGQVLVSMGGADNSNATSWVLKVLAGMQLPSDLLVQVVLGSTAPHRESVASNIALLECGTELIVDALNMAELMTRADLAIGAAGSTSWERCALGLPAILAVLADNQASSAAALAAQGAARCVDRGMDDALRETVTEFLLDSSLRTDMSAKAAAVCDGGGARRVASVLSADSV